MHDFGRTQNSIDRAGLNAKRAANTKLLIDDSNLKGHMGAATCIERQYGSVKQLG
jgi:hypothetical protein